MKVVVSLLFMCLTTFFLPLPMLSQNAEKIKLIDSLEAVLLTETDVDNRFKILSDLLEQNKFHNEEKALYYANILLDESKLLAPHRAYNEARMYIAAELQATSKIDSSLNLINAVLKDAIEIQDVTNEWKSYMLLGNAADNKGNTDEAYDYFLKGFNCHERISDIDKKAQVKIIFGNNLANNLAYHNRYEKALEYFKEALDAVEVKIKLNPKSNTYKNMKGVLFNGISTLYGNIGDEEKALEYILKSVEIRDSIQNISGKLYATINLFDTYLNSKDYKAILDKSTKTLEEADEIGNSMLKIILTSQILTAQIELGNMSEAKRMLDELEKYVEKSEYNVDATHHFTMVSFLYYLKKKQYSTAESILTTAENNAHKSNRTNHLGIIYESKVQLYSQSNNSDLLTKAIDDMNKVMDERLKENISSLGEIEAKYTNLENQKKVELLEKDKEVLSAVSSRNRLAAIGGALLAVLSFLFFKPNKKKE